MVKDPQSRRWIIVLNNPEKYGYSRERIRKELELFSYRYACFSEEKGSEGTTHYHIFLETKGGLRFSTIKSRFPEAHVEFAMGTAAQNRDYISKTGKWKETDKANTNLFFQEMGILPSEKLSATEKKEHLLELIRAGKSNAAIISEDPAAYGYHIRHIDEIRQSLLLEDNRSTYRNVTTYFVTGNWMQASIDLTKKNGPENVCRVTSYRPDNTPVFDHYTNQKILLLENPPKIPFQLLINLQSPLPFFLPCRFADKLCLHDKLYILSTTDFFDQYAKEQHQNADIWHAFISNIDKHIVYGQDGSYEELYIE